MKFVQMEFDFGGAEEVRDYTVEITRGRDGDDFEVRTEFTGTEAAAFGVVASYAKEYPGYRETWDTERRDGVIVVDFGSAYYFGRITTHERA